MANSRGAAAAPGTRKDSLDLKGIYRLSPRVLIRPEGGAFVLQSLETGWEATITGSSVLRLIHRFVTPIRISELLEAVADARGRNAVLAFLNRCCSEAVITRTDWPDSSGNITASIGYWDFADLVFHVHSRRGRVRHAIGGTYPLRGVQPREPAFNVPHSTTAVALDWPRVEDLSRPDPSLTACLERRRTRYSTAAVDLRSLGHFLYRTCRVTGHRVTADGEVIVHKVYPSAGALHPLSVYLIGALCRGLEKAVYYYDAEAHRLLKVAQYGRTAEVLLREARHSTGGALTGDPPVLFLIAARIGRTSWKYSGIAYRLILQEVGALFQTMYLVATAMGLSPCALGTGDSERFSRLVRTDYYRETTVGEFVLAGPAESIENAAAPL